WSSDFLHKFPRSSAERRSARGPHCEPAEQGERRPNCPAISSALRVGWRRCLCYIRRFCFGLSWLPMGSLFARSSHDDRGGARSLRRSSAVVNIERSATSSYG